MTAWMISTRLEALRGHPFAHAVRIVQCHLRHDPDISRSKIKKRCASTRMYVTQRNQWSEK